MTILLSTNVPRVAYTVGQGVVQKVFAVPFEFFDDEDVTIYVDGIKKTLGSHYTLSGGNGAVGTLTFNTTGGTQLITGATGGSTVIIVRDVEISRVTDFATSGDINRTALNLQLDTLVAQIADMDDRLSRTIQLNDFEVAPSMLLTADRKDKILAFNASTGNVEAGPSISAVNTAVTALSTTTAKANEAAASATSAASSATTATAKATIATDKSALAATAKTNAETAETNAETAETNAASSASTATTRANTATAQADIATAKATIATDKAAIATTKASEAASSASSMSSSVTAATAAKDAALAALDSFDDRYLGTKSSDPSVDNDGNSLVAGALYFNTSDNTMKVYEGSAWVAAYASLSGTLLKSGGTMTGNISHGGNFTLDVAGDIILDADGAEVFFADGGTNYGKTMKSGNDFRLKSEISDGDFVVQGVDNGSIITALTLDMSDAGTAIFNNKVGIGTTSPTRQMSVENTLANGGGSIGITSSDSSTSGSLGIVHFGNSTDSSLASIGGLADGSTSAGALLFKTEAAGGAIEERMRIDSSGNLLVGTSGTNWTTTAGLYAFNQSALNVTRDGAESMNLNRLNSDGDIIKLYKSGSTVGSIGFVSTGLVMQGETDHSGLRFGGGQLIPYRNNADSDNTTDIGASSVRFDDIYATNGTIQTSDRNEKQDIASFTATEMLVGKRISTLFKTFKWKDSVAKNGDNARTHTGVIAQDVQAAFTAEGLDAGDYALFTSSTWWEHDVDVPAVEAVEAVEAVDAVTETTTDEEGNEVVTVITEAVEAVEAADAADAYTRTDTYNTLEEAPEGATERTRMGIRYPELLSFVAAYNEQRFASIEARLTALEG